MSHSLRGAGGHDSDQSDGRGELWREASEMSYYAVIREAGPAWAGGKGITAQPGLSDHAAFMNGLAEQGSVLFGGPLAGTEHGRLRALLIVSADDEAEIERSLADDPWTITEQLQITSIEPWNILVGAERVASAHRAE